MTRNRGSTRRALSSGRRHVPVPFVSTSEQSLPSISQLVAGLGPTAIYNLPSHPYEEHDDVMLEVESEGSSEASTPDSADIDALACGGSVGRSASTRKREKAKAEREAVIGYVQYNEDTLRYHIDYAPAIAQSTSNGRSSGLSGDKIEIMAVASSLLQCLLTEAMVGAELRGNVEQLKRRLAAIARETAEHVKRERDLGPRELRLPPSCLMDDAFGSGTICKPPAGTARGIACRAHGGLPGSDGKVTGDWRKCRFAHRSRNMRANSKAILERCRPREGHKPSRIDRLWTIFQQRAR